MSDSRPTSYPWMWCLYRMSVIIGGTVIGILGLYFGYKLIQQGATGEFTISGEKGGFKAFITSISPGLGLSVIGCLVTGLSYWIQKRSWGSITHKEENARRMSRIKADVED